ncbi:hypothetical protein [Streptomonospora salina]|uniref:Uncharacterized protein n=1 Tax=Streptomonospora salina TaxID=104205 RepID=A0A841E4W7_9ACTN|nr:hypothetical protein [Streptomonospora salina]MBB5997812.1 hypothetical protein [Streptomonospora salina]
MPAHDTARMAAVAGKLDAARHAAPDDAPWLRTLLSEALADIDRVRGRSTAVATARLPMTGEVPRQ